MAQKAANPLPHPRMIDVEITNRCNLRCVMCPTGQGTCKRESGDMSFGLFIKVIDQIADLGIPVRFIRWGEPLMHPLIMDIIDEVKVRNLICHINTNGSFLSKALCYHFVKCGLDSIKFSFQGINPRTYERMRNSMQYHKLLDRIKYLYRLREKEELTNPFIQVGTTVTTEPEYAIDLFRQKVDNFVDAVYVGKTRDLQEKVSSSITPCECPEVFDKLSINYDGSVSACCGDYDNYTIVGDLRKETIMDVWNGRPLAKFRKMLLEYRHGENYLCARCARSDRR